MIAQLPLAAAQSRIPSPATIILIIGAIGYVLYSRMQGQPLSTRRLIVLPGIFVVLGLSDVTGGAHKTGADIAFIVGGCVVSAVFGALRGSTIELFTRDGVLWQRYRPVTVALWLVLILSKVVLAVVAHASGAGGGAGTNSLLLSLGISLLAESAVLAPRAQATGVPFAVDTDRRRRVR